MRTCEPHSRTNHQLGFAKKIMQRSRHDKATRERQHEREGGRHAEQFASKKGRSRAASMVNTAPSAPQARGSQHGIKR